MGSAKRDIFARGVAYELHKRREKGLLRWLEAFAPEPVPEPLPLVQQQFSKFTGVPDTPGLWSDVTPIPKTNWTQTTPLRRRLALQPLDQGWDEFLGTLFEEGKIGRRRLPFGIPESALHINWAKVGFWGAAAYLGLRTARNVIRGFDDEYNTIEGLPHQGLAGYYRKQNTNFGSGYTGLAQGIFISSQAYQNSLFGSPFERQVSEGLEEKGWDVSSQFGVRGFSVDVAVRDPRTGEYLAGVEADGVTYHQDKKKDRWRQEIIEGATNKNILRVKSTEWRKGSEEAVARLDRELRREMVMHPRIENYSLFNGLQHRGLAPKLRHQYTDFGSPWRGLWNSVSEFMSRHFTREGRAIGAVSKYLASGAREGTAKLLDPRRAAAVAKSTSSLEEFVENLGFSKIDTGQYRKGNIYANLQRGEEQVLSSLYKPGAGGISNVGKDSGIIDISVSDLLKRNQGMIGNEDFLKGVFYHELLETQSLQRFSKLNPMLNKHASSHVIMGESAFYEYLGNKELNQIWEGKRLGDLSRKAAPWKTYEGTDAAAWLMGKKMTQIPGMQDPFNPIEGMQHKGMAQWLRKIWSDFGSKYDMIRAMAKMTGRTFDDFIGSDMFRTAISKAEVVRKLGSGAYGEASLMSTELMGKKFEFVRKSFHTKTGKFVRRMADPKNEAFMLKELGETSMVPSFYRQEGKDIFMEYMPGNTFVSAFQQTGENLYKNPAFQKEIDEVMKVAASKDIKNLDLHGGNLIHDIKTKRFSWIDWGGGKYDPDNFYALKEMQDTLKSKGSTLESIARGERVHFEIEEPEEEMMQRIVPKNQKPVGSRVRTSRAKSKLSSSASQLLSDQKTLARSAVSGGKGHTSYTSNKSGTSGLKTGH